MPKHDIDLVGPDYGKMLLDEGETRGIQLLKALANTAKPYVADYLHFAVDCLSAWLQNQINLM